MMKLFKNKANAYQTDRGFDRLVNFSDAVVAIAITLLILPLVEVAGDLQHDQQILALIEKNSLRLLVFVISFVVIGRFWLVHHRIYEHANRYNSRLLGVNLLWLMTIVFLPFPTELLATAGASTETSTSLYVGSILAISLTLLWQEIIFIRHEELQIEEVRGSIRLAPSIITSSLVLLAFIGTLLLPNLGLLVLLIILLTPVVNIAVNALMSRKSVEVTESE